MRSAVTVSLVFESRGGPFVFWDDLRAACSAAATLGFDAIELFPPGPDEIEAEDLRKLLHEYKIGIAAIGTGAGFVKHRLDRKSTRLNSSHPVISYAVLC